jgi:hypothetical protein
MMTDENATSSKPVDMYDIRCYHVSNFGGRSKADVADLT